jgi:hypothetical protein
MHLLIDNRPSYLESQLMSLGDPFILHQNWVWRMCKASLTQGTCDKMHVTRTKDLEDTHHGLLPPLPVERFQATPTMIIISLPAADCVILEKITSYLMNYYCSGRDNSTGSVDYAWKITSLTILSDHSCLLPTTQNLYSRSKHGADSDVARQLTLTSH